ncbi:hypothetical protein [Caballeronia sp. LZ001]|uniref:hypothetical protein n=1 Tax=Caballeronia sp. LZ001 TaxID=3038553 RepID=UPI0028605415|nr:hypothetical protein [Caballeronia sp. LZ001]MDR5806564.1 hypothetical protein [Caballeronia sp. LZ001]
MLSASTLETAFDIGWDFARFGRTLDAGVHDPAVLEGFAAGREHFRVPQHRPDRFVSKWLQLRINAYKRRRILDAGVTPSYLRRIDVPFCPITLLPLTHGALCDTDWSVDRINNDGAYAPGNLMVMSVKANKAKGAMSYQAVAEVASACATGNAAAVGLRRLSASEWVRLACVMVGAADVAEVESSLGPLLTTIPEDCRVPLYYVLQQMLLHSALCASKRNQVLKDLNRLQPSAERRLALRCAAERLSIALKSVDFPYDALADALVQRQLRGWFQAVPSACLPALLKLCASHGAEQCEPTLPAAWSIQTHGKF